MSENFLLALDIYQHIYYFNYHIIIGKFAYIQKCKDNVCVCVIRGNLRTVVSFLTFSKKIMNDDDDDDDEMRSREYERWEGWSLRWCGSVENKKEKKLEIGCEIREMSAYILFLVVESFRLFLYFPL